MTNPNWLIWLLRRPDFCFLATVAFLAPLFLVYPIPETFAALLWLGFGFFAWATVTGNSIAVAISKRALPKDPPT